MGLNVGFVSVGKILSGDLEEYVRYAYPFVDHFVFGAATETPEGAGRLFKTAAWEPRDEEQWQEEAVAEGYVSCGSLLLDRMVHDGHLSHGTYLVVCDT